MKELSATRARVSERQKWRTGGKITNFSLISSLLNHKKRRDRKGSYLKNYNVFFGWKQNGKMNYSQINTTQPTRRENAVNGKSLVLHFQMYGEMWKRIANKERWEKAREGRRKKWKKAERDRNENNEIT